MLDKNLDKNSDSKDIESGNLLLNNRFDKEISLEDIILQYNHLSKEELENLQIYKKTAGRIMKIRDMGKLSFIDFSDQTGSIQLKLIKDDNNIIDFKIGDIIGITGKIIRTKTNCLSIEIKDWELLSKCFKNFTNNYVGFHNIEERFRKRYLDFILNKEKRDILITKNRIIKKIRNTLDEKGYIEIETPILVDNASGAQALPFKTFHNKLRKEFYLRIATEISLKKLIVGGFEKVYEVGRIFRNEGIDARHNPEFTTIEIYKAFENGEYMMNLTEEIFNKLTIEKKSVRFNDYDINLEKFTRISMLEAIKQELNIDFNKLDLKQAIKLAKEFKLNVKEYQKTLGHIIYLFFSELVEKKLINPTFVYDFPIETSPLARNKKTNDKMADRFELFIGGLEFANGYSELNCHKEQAKRFRGQLEQKILGNEEIADIDLDFIEALKYGMPPTGGLGIGIDRLVMLLTEQNNIKEVIAFPQLKTK